MENWYLLFYGQSVDGRGDATFLKRTTDVNEAIKFYYDSESDPYSCSYVIMVTDTDYIKCDGFNKHLWDKQVSITDLNQAKQKVYETKYSKMTREKTIDTI